MYKTIPLPNGKETIVDADMYDIIMEKSEKWYLGGGTIKYAMKRFKGAKETVYLHRFIMNAPKGIVVDHINGDPLDNRRENLRLSTLSQNQANRKGKNRPGTSQFKGVYWYKRVGKWLTRVTVQGKLVYSGYFDDEVEAAKAYDKAMIEHYGEYAGVNFP